MIFICIFKIFARAKQFTMHKRMKGKSTFCRFLYCQFKLIGYARPILWLYIHESLFHFLIANLDIIRFDITTVIFVFDMQIRCHHFWIIFYCKLKFSHGFFFYFWTGHIRKYILSYCIIFFIFFIFIVLAIKYIGLLKSNSIFFS